MNNIPTDLLRTLLAVVDFRSFTKAAQSLGVTQPAVSAQIKRLQYLLGGDLFDRSAPGIVLTGKGDEVVAQARRLMAINDQILSLSGTKPSAPKVRIGLPGDLSGPLLPWTLAKFRLRWPDHTFEVRSGGAGPLLAELRHGDLDIVIALSHDEPTDARHRWTDELVWVRSDASKIDADGTVPMLAFSNECMCYRAGVKALADHGRESKLILTATTVLSLSAGVDAGLGIIVMSRGRVRYTQLQVVDDSSLPPLPHLHVGIYVRDGADTVPLNELADDLAPLLRPKADDMITARREYHSLKNAFGKAVGSGA